MKRYVAVAAISIGVLAACSGDPGAGAGPPTVKVPDQVEPETEPATSEEPTVTANPETAAPASTPEEPVRSDRGNLVKELGELGGIVDADGEMLISFWVDEIKVDFECTREYVEEPLNGHYVGVNFRVETAPSLAEEGDGEFWLTAHDMSAWTAAGQRVNDHIGNAFSCPADADMLPSQMGPGEIAEGWIILDLPEDADAVGLTLHTASGRAGWEWLIDG